MREGEISQEEATFSVENDNAKITVIIQYLDVFERNNGLNYSSEVYVLIEIK